jgi:hypothetical protein
MPAKGMNVLTDDHCIVFYLCCAQLDSSHCSTDAGKPTTTAKTHTFSASRGEPNISGHLKDNPFNDSFVF